MLLDRDGLKDQLIVPGQQMRPAKRPVFEDRGHTGLAWGHVLILQLPFLELDGLLAVGELKTH